MVICFLALLSDGLKRGNVCVGCRFATQQLMVPYGLCFKQFVCVCVLSV